MTTRERNRLLAIHNVERVFQTLIAGVRCNVTRIPGEGFLVRRITETGQSAVVLPCANETEEAAVAAARAALEAKKPAQAVFNF
jgi:hypothetical protein